MVHNLDSESNERQEIVLVQLSKINIVSEGNNRTSITSDKVYVNPAHIISVRDYEGMRQFLLREGNLTNQSHRYSILTISLANKVEEIIVLGSSEEIFSKIKSQSGKELLNG